MNASTSTAPVSTAAAPKVSAGDKAIAASVKAGGKASELVKALWSIRGDLRVRVAGFPAPVAVVKAEIVRSVQALKDDAPAPYVLEKLPGNAGWLLVAAPKAASK